MKNENVILGCAGMFSSTSKEYHLRYSLGLGKTAYETVHTILLQDSCIQIRNTADKQKEMKKLR